MATIHLWVPDRATDQNEWVNYAFFSGGKHSASKALPPGRSLVETCTCRGKHVTCDKTDRGNLPWLKRRFLVGRCLCSPDETTQLPEPAWPLRSHQSHWLPLHQTTCPRGQQPGGLVKELEGGITFSQFSHLQQEVDDRLTSAAAACWPKVANKDRGLAGRELCGHD